jgi:hypothetical protein
MVYFEGRGGGLGAGTTVFRACQGWEALSGHGALTGGGPDHRSDGVAGMEPAETGTWQALAKELYLIFGPWDLTKMQ